MLARRSVLKGSVALLLAPLAGCGEKSGPEEIAWGRDACEYCRMIIAEHQFAVELRDPKKKLRKFDDVGCAVHWCKQQAQPLDQLAEFWVMNHADGKTWLDARQAHYRVDVRSPMNYNFGALPAAADTTVPYAEMVRRLGASASNSDCPVPLATG